MIGREFAAMVRAAFRRLSRSDLISVVDIDLSSGTGRWIGRYRALPDRDIILLREEVAGILPIGVLLEVAAHEAAHAAAALNTRHPNYIGHGLPWVRGMRLMGFEPRIDITLPNPLHEEVERCLRASDREETVVPPAPPV